MRRRDLDGRDLAGSMSRSVRVGALYADGAVDTVPYHKLILLLLNELQKPHRQIQQRRAGVAQVEANPAPHLGFSQAE